MITKLEDLYEDVPWQTLCCPICGQMGPMVQENDKTTCRVCGNAGVKIDYVIKVDDLYSDPRRLLPILANNRGDEFTNRGVWESLESILANYHQANWDLRESDVDAAYKEEYSEGGLSVVEALYSEFMVRAYPIYVKVQSMAKQEIWIGDRIRELLPEKFHEYLTVVPSQAVCTNGQIMGFDYVGTLTFNGGIRILVSPNRDRLDYMAMTVNVSPGFWETAIDIANGDDSTAIQKLHKPAIDYTFGDMTHERYNLGQAIFYSTGASLRYQRAMADYEKARSHCARLALTEKLGYWPEDDLTIDELNFPF